MRVLCDDGSLVTIVSVPSGARCGLFSPGGGRAPWSLAWMEDSVRPGLLAFAVAERCQGLCGVDLVMHGWRWAATSPLEARRPEWGQG